MSQINITQKLKGFKLNVPIVVSRIHPANGANSTHIPCTVDKGPCDHAGHWSINTTSLLNWGRFAVYRGMLVRPEADHPIDVVLKFSRWGDLIDNLIREAEVYENEAAALQGSVIPRYYGAFQVQIEDRFLTCLVTEFCGDPLRGYFKDCEKTFLWELTRKFDLLHKHGLKHCDMRERNVVDKDGTPFIIDLELVKPHKCERKMLIKMHCTIPAEGFGCHEMLKFLRKLPFWRSAYTKIDGRSVLTHQLKTPNDALRIMKMKDYDRAKRIVDGVLANPIPGPLPPYKENPENDDEI